MSKRKYAGSYGTNKYRRLFRTGAAVAKQVYSAWNRYGSKRKSGEGSGVTTQYDRRVQYKYRRMPRRMRRRYQRFDKRVSHVINKSLATQTILRNSALSASFVDGAQQTFSVVCYGWKGTSSVLECGVDDMSNIATSVFASVDAKKVRFVNCHVDVTIQNTGATNVEMDIYEYWWRGPEVYVSPNAAWDDAASETPTLAGTALTRNTRGATPFEFPMLCRQLKIIKKTKYLLPISQAMTYQMVDRRDRVVTLNDVIDYASFGKKGFTKGIFIVTKSTVGDIDGDGSVKIGATRTFRFVTLLDATYGDGVIA